MRRSPGNVVLVAALGLLIAAGVAVAKRKHHRGLPRGPYPSLGSLSGLPGVVGARQRAVGGRRVGLEPGHLGGAA